MRVLIVDKLASFRRRLRTWLEDGGHARDNILEAPSGGAALDTLRQEDFQVDAIVCEWEQATVGALDFLKQLRAVPGFTQIGFVAIGPPTPEQERQARSSGATAYLPQPVDPEVLLQTLVTLEKAALEARKRNASPTTRWRILANDAQGRHAPPPAQGVHQAAEAELRKGARNQYVAAGTTLQISHGGPLYWVESGHLEVEETRKDGLRLKYRIGPGQFLNEAPFGGIEVESIAARAEGEVWVSSKDAPEVDRIRRANAVLFYGFRNTANDRARRFQQSSERNAVEKGLAGEIESLPIGDLVGILNGARKTGVLRIQTPEKSYYLQFNAGALCHAECDGQLGEEVFYACLLLSKGHFEFMVGPAVEGPVTIPMDTASLLLEGLKRRATHISRSPRPRNA
jgi:CheY-like chemotaxis protein